MSVLITRAKLETFFDEGVFVMSYSYVSKNKEHWFFHSSQTMVRES